jgi:ABC-type glycerol-3-phosphate transport system substrate-binding protein
LGLILLAIVAALGAATAAAIVAADGAATAVAISLFWGPTPGILSIAINYYLQIPYEISTPEI